MTREKEIENKAIEKSAEYRFGQLYSYNNDVYSGFIQGAQWADAHPKSPGISVDDDLPCNHKELLSKEKEGYTESVMAYTNIGVIFISMKKYNDGWKWETSHYFPRIIIITHWMPIPELPEE